MAKVIIAPQRKRTEILFVAISTVLILSIASLLIFIRKQGNFTVQKLKSYQISGVTDLQGDNQGIYTDLFTAAQDVEYYHQSNGDGENWPSVKTLEGEQLPPFVKDALWEQRGRITWKKYQTGTQDQSVNSIAYVGKSNDYKKVGSFILLMEHYHAPDGTYYLMAGRTRSYSIWFRANNFDLPPIISEGTLISNGWKEVVSITGKDKRKQLNR